jgi:hypothetical protein
MSSPIEARLEEEAMEWFKQKTTIAGTQIPNWVFVLGAVIAIWLIFNLL